MINLIEKIRSTELQDDDTEKGGIEYAGETLGEFMDEVGLNEHNTFGEINNALKECGIKTL